MSCPHINQDGALCDECKEARADARAILLAATRMGITADSKIEDDKCYLVDAALYLGYAQGEVGQ